MNEREGGTYAEADGAQGSHGQDVEPDRARPLPERRPPVDVRKHGRVARGVVFTLVAHAVVVAAGAVGGGRGIVAP